MGYKASIITVQHLSRHITDLTLLDAFGLSTFQYVKETTLEDCIYPGDQSISIGEYNNCLIICDDFQLTSKLDRRSPPPLLPFEEALSDLFPESEILTVACHSGVNFHLYTLVSNGKRVRFKSVAAGYPVIEYGDRIKEEEEVYALSKMIDGKRLFRSFYEEDGEYDMTEDQMMEAFTFGVAARHLGVRISTEEDEELMYKTTFGKYLRR